MAGELPELIVADVAAWRGWLDAHHESSGGVRLVLAKGGALRPTSLTYDQALEEALCVGWIDGQLERRDDVTFRRRFTPRGPHSRWSKRNTETAERLIAEARMKQSGLAAIERARANGEWDVAYAGRREIEVPDDLAAALATSPVARGAFDRLSGLNRYAVLYRLGTLRRTASRAARIAAIVDMLERGETIYPPHQAPA